MIRFRQCIVCEHSQAYDEPGRCKAFPNGIPKELLTEDILHDKPYPGDGGLRYEPRQGGGFEGMPSFEE